MLPASDQRGRQIVKGVASRKETMVPATKKFYMDRLNNGFTELQLELENRLYPFA